MQIELLLVREPHSEGWGGSELRQISMCFSRPVPESVQKGIFLIFGRFLVEFGIQLGAILALFADVFEGIILDRFLEDFGEGSAEWVDLVKPFRLEIRRTL